MEERMTFTVEKGTPAVVVKKDANWRDARSFAQFTTTKESTFYIEDVHIDPLGNVGYGPLETDIQGRWAANGYYGFEGSAYILLVETRHVGVR